MARFEESVAIWCSCKYLHDEETAPGRQTMGQGEDYAGSRGEWRMQGHSPR
jgi:hypothetical protein